MRDAFALDLELFDNLSCLFVFGRIVYKQRLIRRLVFGFLRFTHSIEFLREFINILAKIFNVLFSGIAFRFLSPVDQLLIGLFIGILFGFVFCKLFAGIIKGVFINLFQLLFSNLFWLFFNNLKLFNDLFFRCGIVSCSLFAR